MAEGGEGKKAGTAAAEATVAIDLALASLPGDTIEQKVEYATKDKPVVVVGKEHCPFCLEVRRTFDSLGVPFTLHNVDTMPDGDKVHDALKGMTKQTTVPYVFVGGELLGGCDATKAAQNDGSLFKRLHKLGIHAKAGASGAFKAGDAVLAGKGRALSTLFSFPEVVDDRAARFNGIWGFVICLLVAIYHQRLQAHWVMGGLMVDFVLRFLAGSNFSPLGSLSACCVAVLEIFGSKPRWVAGQSKQFAALCGTMFSTLAFLFYMVSIWEEKLVNVGLAFTCALGAASLLEGFVGFCLGCWMFGLMIQFGLLPSDTFKVYTNSRDEAQYTWEEMNKRLNEGAPKQYRVHVRSDGADTDVDYKYKGKTDDMIREDFHLIKHVKATHFMMHMGLVGLACAWKAAAPHASNFDAPTAVGHAIALGAALLFVIWCVLYILKYIMYRQKVIKEWQHPVAGNAFAVPFICLILFAYMVEDQSHGFAMVLFWIGAPVCMFLSIRKVASWIAYRRDVEHINAAWMIMPVGNAVAAYVGPLISVSQTNACQFWFALAFIMWAILFVATFTKAVLVHDEDDRARPLLAIWVAAPAVLAVGYLGVYPSPLMGTGNFNDFIFINLHWIAVAFCLIFLFCGRFNFFGRLRWDMSFWAAGFPSAAVCFSSIAYNSGKPGNLSYGIAIAALAATSTINCVLALQTLAMLLRRRVFVPDYKWGPMSFMRLTHEAFRASAIKMTQLAEMMSSVSSGEVPQEMVDEFSTMWAGLSLAHQEHSKHEEEAIFVVCEEFYPGVSSHDSHTHEELHVLSKGVQDAIAALATARTPAAAGELSKAMKAFLDELLEHLRHEEDHIVPLPKKYLNLAIHKETARKVWKLSPAATWFKLLPWIINNLPMQQQRARYLKTLLWAMPERAQQMGLMVALGVDDVLWRRLTDDLPEIMPRAADGYIRYW